MRPVVLGQSRNRLGGRSKHLPKQIKEFNKHFQTDDTQFVEALKET